MRLPYRSVLYTPSITRLRVTPDDPAAIVGPRPRGSRRPHTDASVAAVRRLIEQTTLTYGEIAAKTGIGRASICRWTRDQNWQRPVFAPRATDTVPSARASARLKRRTLAARLSALAERHVRELEESACVDPDKLAEALELLKMAKFAALGRRRRRKPLPPPADLSDAAAVPAQQRDARLMSDLGTHNPGAHESTPVSALQELRSAGIDPARAPQAALEAFIDSRKDPRDFPELRPRGQTSRRNREHARLLERYERG